MNFSWRTFAAGFVVDELIKGFLYNLVRNKKFDVRANTVLFSDMMFIVDINRAQLKISGDRISTLKNFFAELSTERRDALIDLICADYSGLPPPFDHKMSRGILFLLYLISLGSEYEMNRTVTSWGIEDNSFLGKLDKWAGIANRFLETLPDGCEELGITDREERSKWALLISTIKLQVTRDNLNAVRDGLGGSKNRSSAISPLKVMEKVKKMGKKPEQVRAEIHRTKKLPFSYQELLDD